MFSRNPPALLPWPHWRQTDRAITISGRHMTIGRWRVAGILALLPVAAFDWYLHMGTRFTLGPTGYTAPMQSPRGLNWQLIFVAEYLQAKFSDFFKDWDWINVYRVVVWPLYALSPVYFYIFRFLIGMCLLAKTTIVFAGDYIEIPPRLFFRRRYLRSEADNIEFFLWKPPSGKQRRLHMRYGMNEPVVTTFIRPKTAERFWTLLPIAMSRSATAQLHAFPVIAIEPPEPPADIPDDDEEESN